MDTSIANRLACAFLVALAIATPALADPCEWRVSGYRPGQTITAQVRYAGDGDSLCLSRSSDPATWLEIRLADFDAPELNQPGGKHARAVTRRMIGRTVTCTVQRGRDGRTRSFDRVIAACPAVARELRRAGVREGGR